MHHLMENHLTGFALRAFHHVMDDAQSRGHDMDYAAKTERRSSVCALAGINRRRFDLLQQRDQCAVDPGPGAKLYSLSDAIALRLQFDLMAEDAKGDGFGLSAPDACALILNVECERRRIAAKLDRPAPPAGLGVEVAFDGLDRWLGVAVVAEAAPEQGPSRAHVWRYGTLSEIATWAEAPIVDGFTVRAVKLILVNASEAWRSVAARTLEGEV